MTPRQIELARHALGLTETKKSYRNRFYASEGHRDFPDWQAMVAAGDAVQHPDPGGHDLFELTRQGAEKVLKRGETLCPEDFPAGAPA